jgi:hypothetical protein
VKQALNQAHDGKTLQQHLDSYAVRQRQRCSTASAITFLVSSWFFPLALRTQAMAALCAGHQADGALIPVMEVM